jgi:hypothetical protein
MKAVIPVVFIVFLAGVAVGQKTQPDPPVVAVVQAGEEIPTPSGTPEPQVAPELLPESSRLPAAPPDLRLPSPSILKPEGSNSVESSQATKPLSPEEEARNKARLSEIRQIAMRNPRVNDLLRQANGALMDEAKREFMRAYVHTLCTRMRYLDSSLGSTISAYERAEIRKLAVGPSRISIASRDLARRERQRRARTSD